MKNLITILFLIFTLNSITAAENEGAFCMNKLQGQTLQIADMWLVHTNNLKNNPILGQFYKFGHTSLEANALSMQEIELFLTNYSDKLRFGEGNYFVLKQNNNFFILSVNRTEEKLFFEIKNLDEVITSQYFIYIMIPKKAGV